MRIRDKSVLLIATGCFIGNSPFAPGSLGTLVGIPICFLLSKIDIQIAIICIIIFIPAAIFISHEAEKLLKKNDPGPVVIDEIAGIMVTLAGLPFNAVVVVLGFIIFRLLDIFKPFPIKQVELKFSGGIGIVMDDIMAGVMSNVILRVFIYLTNLF
ncbi:MAG: phosphatidylglycerophosphatase A [Desulfobacterales bacterium]|nr:phosphatidylglycerophosphatase A [Desulfobacterales bacterium]